MRFDTKSPCVACIDTAVESKDEKQFFFWLGLRIKKRRYLNGECSCGMSSKFGVGECSLSNLDFFLAAFFHRHPCNRGILSETRCETEEVPLQKLAQLVCFWRLFQIYRGKLLSFLFFNPTHKVSYP